MGCLSFEIKRAGKKHADTAPETVRVEYHFELRGPGHAAEEAKRIFRNRHYLKSSVDLVCVPVGRSPSERPAGRSVERAMMDLTSTLAMFLYGGLRATAPRIAMRIASDLYIAGGLVDYTVITDELSIPEDGLTDQLVAEL